MDNVSPPLVSRRDVLISAAALLAVAGFGGCTPTGSGSVRVPTQVPGTGEFIAGVSNKGRHFVTQDGQPILVKGDSPWSLFTDLSTTDSQLYFDTRKAQGFNAALVSAVGSEANGAPSNNGATFDGILPFDDGDVTQLNEAYWSRVDVMVEQARDAGFTLMIYPIDAWNAEPWAVFANATLTNCHTYGKKLAERWTQYPNIIWAFGGDYYPTDSTATGSDVDHRFNACLEGIRQTGNAAPVTLQLGFTVRPTSSFTTENLYWASRVDWNFVYSYTVTYNTQLDAMASNPMLAMFGEGAYLGDVDNFGTPEVLRKQFGWAITSGSPGTFTGSDTGWKFDPGWESAISQPTFTYLQHMRQMIEQIDWTSLAPNSTLITSGRGNKVTGGSHYPPASNDFLGTAVNSARSLGLAYVPTARTFGVNLSVVADANSARWVDPTNGGRTVAGLSSSYTTPGNNSAGGVDWFLIFE